MKGLNPRYVGQVFRQVEATNKDLLSEVLIPDTWGKSSDL